MNYDDLLNCRCALPFDLLGVRDLAKKKGKQVTCWFPGATEVNLLDWMSGDSLGAMKKLDARGLFQIVLDQKKADALIEKLFYLINF